MAESTPKPAGQAEQRDSAKSQSTTNQTNTITFPSSINTIVSGKIEVESKPQESAAQNQSHYDWPVAGVTLLLVLVTGYLVHYTKKLWGATREAVIDAKAASNQRTAEMQSSLAIAKKSADAASHSVSAALDHFKGMQLSERAYVKISHRPPGVQIGDNGEYWIATTIKNFGRTPARVTDFRIYPMLRTHKEAPPAVPIYAVETDVRPPAFLVAGEEVSYSQAGMFTMTEDDVVAVRTGSKRLYAYGYVDYIDTFGQKHRAGYGRYFVPALDRRKQYATDADFDARSNLVYMNEPGYNYDRERKEGEGNDWGDKATA